MKYYKQSRKREIAYIQQNEGRLTGLVTFIFTFMLPCIVTDFLSITNQTH